MPMYLKRDAIRFIEASVSAISMAVAALGMPRRYDFREEAAENAVAIGIAGVAAELSMSAVIVQAQGEDALKFPTGFYKTGSHIVDDFKKLVGSQIPKMMFLTQGIEEPSTHIAKLLEMASKLKLLTKLRAGGLHAGRGPSMDVSIACVNDVIAFISLLGTSSRIKSYIDTLPKPITITKSYDLIVDELIQKVAQSNTTLEKVSLLASVYLVIPELPDDEPEWFPAFERALVAPQENDISFLLDTLEKSRYGSLIKVSKGKESIPVTIQKGNIHALPIEPQYLKKSFRDIKDRLYADIGTANGRLDQKQFDAPPIESVYEMFAFPYHVIGITQQEDEQLSATETWPLVASSLSYSGTLGPYWYFVRKTADLGQLESYINRAAKYAGKTLKNGIKEFKPYIEKMRKEIPLSKNDKQISVLLSEYEKSGEKKKKLIDLSEKYIGKEKELCQEAQDDLQKLMEEELHVGDLLIKLVENVYSFQTEESQKYWARTLCECATELEDARGLYAVISETNFSSAYTAVRKAFRIIDFINYGPKLE